MDCSNCGNRLLPSERFCPKCGTPAPAQPPAPTVFCAQCGAQQPVGAVACASCGAAVGVVARASATIDQAGQTTRALASYAMTDGFRSKPWVGAVVQAVLAIVILLVLATGVRSMVVSSMVSQSKTDLAANGGALGAVLARTKFTSAITEAVIPTARHLALFASGSEYAVQLNGTMLGFKGTAAIGLRDPLSPLLLLPIAALLMAGFAAAKYTRPASITAAVRGALLGASVYAALACLLALPASIGSMSGSLEGVGGSIAASSSIDILSAAVASLILAVIFMPVGAALAVGGIRGLLDIPSAVTDLLPLWGPAIRSALAVLAVLAGLSVIVFGPVFAFLILGSAVAAPGGASVDSTLTMLRPFVLGAPLTGFGAFFLVGQGLDQVLIRANPLLGGTAFSLLRVLVAIGPLLVTTFFAYRLARRTGGPSRRAYVVAGARVTPAIGAIVFAWAFFSSFQMAISADSLILSDSNTLFYGTQVIYTTLVALAVGAIGGSLGGLIASAAHSPIPTSVPGRSGAPVGIAASASTAAEVASVALVASAAPAPPVASVPAAAFAPPAAPPIAPVSVAAAEPHVVGPGACPGCGAPLYPGDRFCDGCGAPLATVTFSADSDPWRSTT